MTVNILPQGILQISYRLEDFLKKNDRMIFHLKGYDTLIVCRRICRDIGKTSICRGKIARVGYCILFLLGHAMAYPYIEKYGKRPVTSLLLMKIYGNRPEAIVDYVIAATAWSKKLPLLTRNKKHFSYIKEITLSPVYEL